MTGRGNRLALEGGTPVRSELLPYGRHSISEDDIAAVAAVLRSDWLTTGPLVNAFETKFLEVVGARQAVSVSSGTAGLHAAAAAAKLCPGDEVIVPAMTFVATAASAVYQGGTPVFADVDPETLLIDVENSEHLLTPRTKAIIAVDYAGQPCDYQALHHLRDRHGLTLVADACHALGASYRGQPVGSLADMTVFSLHPVKHITSGEGGMIATSDCETAAFLRRFRNHGIDADSRVRAELDSWYYEVGALGYNYRLTDVQCALGLSQLGRLGAILARRRSIAQRYREALSSFPGIRPLSVRDDVEHAYHLFVVRFPKEAWAIDRGTLFKALRAEGIGVNVHYIPVHLHPYYRERFGTGPGLCPNAEAAYEELVSLPIHPSMTDNDVDDVLMALSKVRDRFASE